MSASPFYFNACACCSTVSSAPSLHVVFGYLLVGGLSLCMPRHPWSSYTMQTTVAISTAATILHSSYPLIKMPRIVHSKVMLQGRRCVHVSSGLGSAGWSGAAIKSGVSQSPRAEPGDQGERSRCRSPAESGSDTHSLLVRVRHTQLPCQGLTHTVSCQGLTHTVTCQGPTHTVTLSGSDPHSHPIRVWHTQSPYQGPTHTVTLSGSDTHSHLVRVWLTQSPCQGPTHSLLSGSDTHSCLVRVWHTQSPVRVWLTQSPCQGPTHSLLSGSDTHSCLVRVWLTQSPCQGLTHTVTLLGSDTQSPCQGLTHTHTHTQPPCWGPTVRRSAERATRSTIGTSHGTAEAQQWTATLQADSKLNKKFQSVSLNQRQERYSFCQKPRKLGEIGTGWMGPSNNGFFSLLFSSLFACLCLSSSLFASLRLSSSPFLYHCLSSCFCVSLSLFVSLRLSSSLFISIHPSSSLFVPLRLSSSCGLFALSWLSAIYPEAIALGKAIQNWHVH